MKKEILFDYEQLLLGNKSNISIQMLPSPVAREQTAIEYLRCAIEYFLRWTPRQAEMFLTKTIVHDMKLDRVIPFIRFPTELDPNEDFFFAVHMAYPNEIPYSEGDAAIRIYKDLESGKRKKLPKKFLEDEDGFERAFVLLRYIIGRDLIFHDIREAYDFFGSSNGSNFLKSHKLSLVCKTLFNSPLDYFHESLQNVQRDELYYVYHKFWQLYRKGVQVRE